MIRDLAIHTPHGNLHGRLDRPPAAQGLIVLARAHHAPIDRLLADLLVEQGFAVLSMDLLTLQETQFADATLNVPRLAQRLIEILDLARSDGDMEKLPLGIYASGDTTPAAIRAAAQRDAQVRALVCHGGLLDRAGVQALELLVAPLLMLFDSSDPLGPAAYRRAGTHLNGRHAEHQLEAGDDALAAAIPWFLRYLPG